MKTSSVILVSLLALVAGASTVRTQDNTALYGKVRGEDHKQAAPPDWKAEVFAVVAGNNRAISTESDEDLYLVQVPTNAKVTLWFHSPGYVAKELRPINTGTNPKKAVRPSLVVLTKPLGNSLTTASTRQKVIGAIIDFGIATGAVDLVMYDLGVIRATVADNLEAVRDIVQARAQFSLNPRVQPLITPERQDIWLLFDKVILRNLGNNIEIDPGSLLAAVKNESLVYGLRYEAIRALATPDSDKQSVGKGNAFRNLVIRNQALTYFRQQSLDSGSTLFAPSRYALAEIGTDADKQSIINDVGSDDLDRAAAAISAIGRANLVSGNEVIARMAENPNVDPSIRIAAIQSLDSLATRRETVRIAVESLTKILETGADPDLIRIQAADALTGAQLSDGQRLRIQKVANQDPSPNIRAAAGGLGTVKPLQRRIP